MRRVIVDTAKSASSLISVTLNKLLGSRAEGALGILVYHRVSPIPPGVVRPTWNVQPERFRRQMLELLDRGYSVWPLKSVIDYCMSAKTIPSKVTAITFDDGYETVYLRAWPVLQELRIPATIFVATAYLDSHEPFPFDDWGSLYHEQVPPETWRPLTWAQCQEMESAGLIEIGTHSHTHGDFRGNPESLKQDLRMSLEILQEKLGARRYSFAFPYGSRQLGFVDDSLLNVAQEAGVACAFTTEIELVNLRSSPFGWGRIEAVETDTGTTLSAKLEGWYCWMGKAREWFRLLCPPAAIVNSREGISQS